NSSFELECCKARRRSFILKQVDLSRTHIYRGREVRLTGRVAKSSRDQLIYEIAPIDSQFINEETKWASESELSIVAKRKLDGSSVENQTKHDYIYLDLLRDVLENGVSVSDRTGTGTISTFAKMMQFDLSARTIPLLTTKKMHIHSILHEIIWYLSGSTNIQYLRDNNVRIWNEWATED